MSLLNRRTGSAATRHSGSSAGKAGERLLRLTPGAVAITALGMLYGLTLQTVINGSDHLLLVDSAEIQVALSLGGTIHYTGYPLYTLTGIGLTRIGVWAGLSPAAAASATSLLWSLVAAALLYRLLLEITGDRRVLSGLAVLFAGVLQSVWLHSIVAEVYGFALIWLYAMLWTAVRLGVAWSDRDWLLAMLFAGVGVSHHRLMVLALPALPVLAYPGVIRHVLMRPRFIGRSLLLFGLPFLSYLYLPVQAWRGADWVYGRPGTWRGFWEQFTGSEATGIVLQWPENAAAWQANGRLVAELLAAQLTWPMLLIGIVGLLWLARAAPMRGLALLAVWGGVVSFVAAFPLGVSAEAALLPALAVAVMGISFFLRPFRQVGWIVLAGATLWLIRPNLAALTPLVADRRGVEIISTLAPLRANPLPGPSPTVALPWGGDYFAAAYGRFVTHELDGFALVDHRADLVSILKADGRLLTFTWHLGRWPYEAWQQAVPQVFYSTVAPNVAVISSRPLFNQIPARRNFPLGNGVVIHDAVVTRNNDELRLTVYWRAEHAPDADYSVAVHVLSHYPARSPQDVLAQADALHPVGGWYPLTLWPQQVVVRDDYAIPLPDSEAADLLLAVGMYQQLPDGAFVNSAWLVLPVPEPASDMHGRQ